MTEAQQVVLNSVRDLCAERAELRRLLQAVADGHTYTSRDDVALIQVPSEIFDEIRARLN